MNREALKVIADACRDIAGEINEKLELGSDVDVAGLASALSELGALGGVVAELDALPEPEAEGSELERELERVELAERWN